MRNATRVETQTSKVPTRVTLLFIPYTVTSRMYITAVCIKKTTREVFIDIKAGNNDKRDHEIAKKIKCCQFVNNTPYGFPTCNFILCWKCF